jgi:hypothetical protein
MPRLYHYVGPRHIADRVSSVPAGVRIASAGDVLRWFRQTAQDRDRSGRLTATFVVDDSGWLRIADRRSEHVACAGGRPVLSAGEITFRLSPGAAEVAEVTNQSTGYCPEPESWPAVKAALTRAGFEASDGFTRAFDFRRCVQCGSINIVKDGLFECASCSGRLPVEWNLSLEHVPEDEDRGHGLVG